MRAENFLVILEKDIIYLYVNKLEFKKVLYLSNSNKINNQNKIINNNNNYNNNYFRNIIIAFKTKQLYGTQVYMKKQRT